MLSCSLGDRLDCGRHHDHCRGSAYARLARRGPVSIGLLTAAAPDGGDEQRVSLDQRSPPPQVSRKRWADTLGKESADARAGASDRCFRGVSDWFRPRTTATSGDRVRAASPQSNCCS